MLAACVAVLGIPARDRGSLAAAGEAPKVADLSGPQLIDLLGRKPARLRAFRELLRRSGNKDADIVDSAEVIPCPQPDGEPLFLVLRRFAYRSRPETPSAERFQGFRVDDPRSLFGEAMERERPLPPHGPFDRRDDLVIHLFDAKGKELVRPFEGNNVLSGGVIADIDGDGFVERAETQPTHVEIKRLTGAEHADVLRVERVGLRCRPTLELLYNFGPRDDWDYRFADPDAIGEEERRQVARAVARDTQPAPPPPKPYRFSSLQDLTDRQLSEFMGPGRSAADFSRDGEDDREKTFPTQLPEGFWTLQPRAAALAFADANRTAAHRERHILAIDDRDGARPPAVCSVYYSLRPGRGYGRRGPRKFFLRVDPAGSFFACSSSAETGGWEFLNGLGSGGDYDLRLAKLPYEQARRISDVLWYLRRLRSRDLESDGPRRGSMSSSDGRGYLRLAVGDAEPIAVEGTAARESVSARWDEAYGPDELVSLAAHLLTGVLPRTLGDAWAGQEPARGPKQEAAKQIREPVGRLIERFSPDESLLAFSMLEDAVTAVGDVAIKDCRPQLERLREALPEPATPVRTLRQATKERSEAAGKAGYDSRLSEEVQRLEHGGVPAAARESLRQAVGVARRRLDLANDADKLLEEVRSTGDDWEWAMGRLQAIDKERFVAALLHWKSRADAKVVSRVFDTLDQTDPEAATILARHVGQGERQALAERTATPVEKALAVADEKARIEALIQIALDPEKDSYDRQKAVRHLVPREEPLRHADPGIDEALVKLLDPEPAKQSTHAEMHAEACRELAAELERIATAGPEDYANYDYAVSRSSDGSLRPVEGRCHLPRKILALWSEEHPPTRARLLVAFGQERCDVFEGLIRETIERQLEEIAAGIQEQGRDDYARDVLRFVDWSENHFLGIDRDPGGQIRRLWAFARKAFAP